jgi:hypothetical protein
MTIGNILWPFGMYILWSFGIFFPVLVFFTKKNLATPLKPFSDVDQVKAEKINVSIDYIRRS